MTLEETGILFDHIVHCYPQFTADLAKLRTWQEVLKDVSLETALQNFKQYSAKSANQYPPHPGALAIEGHSESDKYHSAMKESGQTEITNSGLRAETATPPTVEQMQKVREILAQSRS